MDFVVEIVAVSGLFFVTPICITGGIILNRMLKNKTREIEIRERELALEERRLALDEQAYAQSLLEESEHR